MQRRGAGLRSESGQGIVEYVLLLVVILTLVFAVGNRFFKPFREWTQFYLGDYVECLLDQGELPSLGGEGTTVSDCETTKKFAVGSNASGNGNSGTGESESGSTSKTPKESEAEKAVAAGAAARAGRNSGGGISYSGRSSRGFRIGGADGASGVGEHIEAGAENRATKEKRSSTRPRRWALGARFEQSRAARVTGLAGLLAAEKAKIKKREQKIQKVAQAEGEETVVSEKMKKFAVKTTERKAKMRDLELDDWSFGKLLRVILILVIAIALFLFVAGQLVQISKGMEK